MTNELDKNALLEQMRMEVEYTDKATMSIPLYEKIKEYLANGPSLGWQKISKYTPTADAYLCYFPKRKVNKFTVHKYLFYAAKLGATHCQIPTPPKRGGDV